MFINIDEYPEMLAPEIRLLIRQEIAADTLLSANAIIGNIHPHVSFYTKYGKRILDIIIALFALIVTAPINLILAICTYFDVGKPILFRQQRTGKDEELFTIYKFRNMRDLRDKSGNLLLGRDRVTKFGKFVRRTSLDELLNFVSILKGDMSVIGPRPLPDAYTQFLADKHRKRYAVRPGLECPFLQPLTHKVTWSEQFENDAWYVENISFMTDIRMLIALVRTVFDRRSTKMRASSVRGSFMGYFKDGSSMNSQMVPEEYVTAVCGGIPLENKMRELR